MVFQDPRAHINPVRRIGDFLTEALRIDRGRSAARGRAPRGRELLDEVGIDGRPSAGCGSTRTSSPAACCNAS